MPIVRVDCIECEGEGKKLVDETFIDPAVLPRHLTHAKAYESCDCPRITRERERVCIACGGSGTKTIIVEDLPVVGSKVQVRSRTLLDMMGIPDLYGVEGTVMAINDPVIDDSDKLPEGLRDTYNVTFAPTNKKGAVIDGNDPMANETWGFLVTELKPS